MWNYIDEHNIHIKETRTQSPNTWGNQDLMIIDACVALGYKDKSVQKINRYCIYLHVTSLQEVRAVGSSHWYDVYNMK